MQRLVDRLPDDRPRCSWATSAPDYVSYHDDEWGTPLHGEAHLFERVSLEAFQSGLSWLIILRKRPAFRAAFADFDPAADLILAAIDGGAPVGLAYASFRLKPEIGALLDNLHVAPERKGGGLGTRLLAGVARWLVEDHGAAALHLEVYAPNAAALAFYEARGGVEA